VNCITGGGSVNSPNAPANSVWAADGGRGAPPLYATAKPNNAFMNAAAVGLSGGNIPHNNMPPYLTVYFVIALQGIYPPRS